MFFSCKEKEVKDQLVFKKNRETILLFKSIPKDTIKLKKGGVKFSPVVNLINSNKEDILNINQSVREVKIKNNRSSFIRHVYRMDDLYFELNDSDTILYFENHFFPFYKTKNKRINVSNDYEYIRKKYLNIESPSNWTNYFVFNVIINKRINAKNAKKEFIDKMLKDELKEQHLLDSLYKLKRLTFKMYELQKNKLRFNKYNTFLSPQFKKNKDKYLIEDSLILQMNKPQLLKFKFYKSFLNNYLKNKFKIKNINYSNNSFSNPKTFFDSVAKTRSLNKEIKEFLLTEKLEEIAEKLSKKELLKYFKLFKNLVKDNAIITDLENKYLISYSTLKTNTSTVNLITKTGEKVIFQDFVNQNKGKLIYIDFWASWCAPCIKEMPSSHRLQEAYKDKNIVFLYLSIDSNKNKWEKANGKQNLTHKKSFLVLNYPSANFFKELKIKTIPRYLLYNKKGELIHKDAPRPSSDEIKNLINQYLK